VLRAPLERVGLCARHAQALSVHGARPPSRLQSIALAQVHATAGLPARLIAVHTPPEPAQLAPTIEHGTHVRRSTSQRLRPVAVHCESSMHSTQLLAATSQTGRCAGQRGSPSTLHSASSIPW